MSDRSIKTGMRKQLVSLEDFLKGKKPRIINSPRSLEACLRQGLDPAELIPKSLAKFWLFTDTKLRLLFFGERLW